MSNAQNTFLIKEVIYFFYTSLFHYFPCPFPTVLKQPGNTTRALQFSHNTSLRIHAKVILPPVLMKDIALTREQDNYNSRGQIAFPFPFSSTGAWLYCWLMKWQSRVYPFQLSHVHNHISVSILNRHLLIGSTRCKATQFRGSHLCRMFKQWSACLFLCALLRNKVCYETAYILCYVLCHNSRFVYIQNDEKKKHVIINLFKLGY